MIGFVAFNLSKKANHGTKWIGVMVAPEVMRSADSRRETSSG